MFPASRRRFLSAAAATALTGPALSGPLRAQAERWTALRDGAARLEQLHAIRVLQDGAAVLTERFRGPGLNKAVPIKSVSKSLVSALTGAAIDRGEIGSVDATLGDLAPRLIPPGADPRVAGITVGDLASLRAGLERTSGGNYGAWVSSPNWVADALSRPVIATPGTRMLYSTGSTHVLGAILAEVSGRSLLDLTRERLGDPLGLTVPPWTRDPQGRFLGGNEMALTLNGMARFGQLYIQKGRWDGTQVLSADWVAASLSPLTRSPFSGLAYGYGWFLGTADGTDFALARGYGGQIVFLAREPALVVAITSDPLRPARSGGYFGALMRLLTETALPAARAT